MKHATIRVARLTSPLTAVLVIILLLSVASTAAADIVCDHCGEEITRGGWIEFEDKYFHPDHFICANCGGDLRDGGVYVENGQMYDSACYIDMFLPKCGHCGQPIQGTYAELDSVLYHKLCYESNVGPRCSICGEAIYGQYMTDLRGNSFHPNHEDDYPECEYCGCLISGGGERYSDGRHICDICLETAIDDIDEAKEIMADIIENLAGHGIRIKEKKVPLELTDQFTMQAKSDDWDGDAAGYTSYKRKSILHGIWSFTDFEIAILYGMPRAEYIFTLAHELMHIWLFKFGKSEMDRVLTEGSCQYAAMLAISDLKGEQADLVRKKAVENTDQIYGDGFRQVDAFVTEVGKHAWLEYLKKHKKLLR